MSPIKAITTRPSRIEGVAQQTQQARTVQLKMTSVHGKARSIAEYLSRISDYFRRFISIVEQLEPGGSGGRRCCGRSSTNSAAGRDRGRGISGHSQQAECRS